MVRPWLIVVLGLALAGCLERRERLVVSDDGSVLAQLEYTASDQSEFGGAIASDAMPTAQAGWEIEQFERDRNGDRSFVLKASREFGPYEPLPPNFAGIGDRNADAYLQSETEVRIEDRPDGTYYSFRRLYPRRDWAEIAALRKTLIDDPLESLKGTSPEQMTEAQRQLVVNAMTSFESAKLRYVARLACREAASDLALDRWFLVDHALEGLEISRDSRDVVAVLFDPKTDDDRRLKVWTEAQAAFEADAFNVLDHVFRVQCGLPIRVRRAVEGRMRLLLKSLAVTEGLSDDSFEITVVLPGKIVGTNGQVGAGREVHFQFRGDDLRDRDRELLVSSVVQDPA